MAENVNINVTENIDQVNIVASEVVEVVDLNLYATTEDVTINVTEEIIQVNINKVTASNVTKTSDLINDGEDGINPFITLNDIPPIDVSTLVPYTGANQNVDLGEFELKAGQIEFDTTPTGTAGVGVMRWNDSDGTLDLGLKGGNVTLQLGQEQLVRAVNKTATNITLLESDYQAVRVTGAQGQRLKVDLAQATNDLLSAETIGLVTETIANNQEGFITISGLVRNINTTGSLQGETWNDGDILYLSPTTAGRITNIKPSAPNHLVVIGYVVYAHANNGKIFVKVNNGYELEELHDVTSTNYTTPIDSDSVLTYDVTNSLWKRLSWSNIKSNLKTYFDTIYQAALGFTPENVANKSTSTSLGTSDTLYPTQNAVKSYVDTGLGTKQNTLVSGTNIKTIENQSILGSGNIDLSKSDVGLGNVDNTSDLNKPISTATQNALDLKLTAPTFRQRNLTKQTVSGTTALVELWKITIPANTFSATDVLKIPLFQVTKTGGNGNFTLQIKMSTSSTLPSGTTDRIATFSTSSATLFTNLKRTFTISGGNLIGFSESATTAVSDEISTTASKSTKAFDPTVTNYLYFTAQLGSALDSLILEIAEATNL